MSISGTGAHQPVYTVPANSRLTVNYADLLTVAGASLRFGVLVESIGSSPVPIVVEGSFYWTIDGVVWAAGSNAVATPIP
jgi:hypothetical protein